MRSAFLRRPRFRRPRSTLAVAVVAGVAIFALSFVPAWIVHHRELTGEGYRTLEIQLSAWRDVARPVVTAAAVGGLLTAALAALRLARPSSVPHAAVVAVAAVTFALLGASAWPVSQSGHASTVTLTPGWALLVSVAVGLAGTAAVLLAGEVPRGVLVVSAGLAVVVVIGGSAGRVTALHLEEGDGRHWEEGSYTRAATGGEPTETLTITGDRYRISDRWSGRFEWSGWTVVFDDDPACPDARGSYHAHAAEGNGLRFVRIVDPCRDGERERDLETGIWIREP